VAEPLPGRDTQLYYFYDESQVWSDLDQLRNILVAAWLVLAAKVGREFLRRTAGPLSETRP